TTQTNLVREDLHPADSRRTVADVETYPEAEIHPAVSGRKTAALRRLPGRAHVGERSPRPSEMRVVPTLRVRVPAESDSHHARFPTGAGVRRQRRERAAGVRHRHAALHLLRLLRGSLPGGSDLSQE